MYESLGVQGESDTLPEGEVQRMHRKSREERVMVDCIRVKVSLNLCCFLVSETFLTL